MMDATVTVEFPPELTDDMQVVTTEEVEVDQVDQVDQVDNVWDAPASVIVPSAVAGALAVAFGMAVLF